VLKVKATQWRACSGTTKARNPEIKRTCWSAPRPGRFSPGKSGTYCTGGCVDLAVALYGAENLTPPAFDPWTVEPVSIRYTDWAIGPPQLLVYQHSQILRSAPHNVFMCFVRISEQTATCATYSINWLVFITKTECVYCAVRTGYLNKAVCASALSENKQRLVPLTA
jgi:hypothetical protein